MTVLSGQVRRGLAASVLRYGRAAVAQEQLHHLQMALQSCGMQRATTYTRALRGL